MIDSGAGQETKQRARENASDHVIIKGLPTANTGTDNSDSNDGRRTARGNDSDGANSGEKERKKERKTI